MIVGFTGTRRGLTALQMKALAHVLHDDAIELLVHGGAKGADATADMLATTYKIERRVRPGPHSTSWQEGAEVMPAVENLLRNRDIVDDADVLIACPSTYQERQRSGTWATIRCARKRGIPIRIIWNDGSQSEELP